MKKKILLISCVLMVILIGISVTIQNGEKFLNLDVLSSKEYDHLVGDRNEIEIENPLLFGGIKAPYDRENDQWLFYDKVPQNGISIDGDYQLAWIKDEVYETLEASISNDQIFTLIAYNKEEYDLKQINITTLPMISIVSEDLPVGKYQVIDDISFKWVEKGQITFYGESVEGDQVKAKSYPIHINVRGATAQVYDKKSFKINLRDEKDQPLDVSLSATRNDNDWVLNSIYSDRSRMREKYVAELWQDMIKTQNTPPIKGFGLEYVELVINDEYLGVYMLGELIDAKQLELNREEDFVFKCYVWSDEYEFVVEEFINADDTTKATSTLEAEFLPEDKITQSWNMMATYFQVFMQEDVTLEQAKEVANIENQIDIAILKLYGLLTDNDPKNLFYVGKATTEGSYTVYKELWDLNYSMGDIWSEELSDAFTKDAITNERFELTNEIQVLLEGPDKEIVKQMIKDRWEELRTTILSEETIDVEIDGLFETLGYSGGLIRENNKWQQDIDFIYERDRMKVFAKERALLLDDYFKEL